MSLLPMSFMVSLLLLFFLFSHFLFSLFVLFLHVQFCKANSRYCISQLVSLQRKFTVSCSLLRYSVNGFISIFINLPLSPSLMPSLPPCFFQKSFPSLWKTSRPTYGGRTGRCATSPYNACDLIVSNSVVFCTLTVIYFPPFLCSSPISLIIFLCSLLNYFPSPALIWWFVLFSLVFLSFVFIMCWADGFDVPPVFALLVL